MEIENKLPNEYLNFLSTHSGSQPYEYDHVTWWIATSNELHEQVNIDGKDFPFINQLRGYVSTLKGFFGEDFMPNENYSLSRLEEGIAIADGNGDVLFLDPKDNFSVWHFYHDGGDVERVSSSFSQWLEMAKLDTDY